MVVAAVFAATVALAVGITVGLAVSLILLVGAVAAILIVIGLLGVAIVALVLTVAGPVLAAMSVVSFALSRLVADGVRPPRAPARRSLPQGGSLRRALTHLSARRPARVARTADRARGAAPEQGGMPISPGAEDGRPRVSVEPGPARFGLPR